MRIGTRGSALALAQARWVAERLGGATRAGDDHDLGRPRPADRRQVALGVRARAGAARGADRPRRALRQGCAGRACRRARAGGDPRACGSARCDLRRAVARRAAARRPGRDEQPAPSRPDAGAARRSRGRAASAATSTPGCASSPRGECDALVLALRGARAPRPLDEAGGVLDELVPAAGQGALALEARAGRVPARCASCVSDRRCDRVRDRRARARPRPRRLLQHARRRACAPAVGRRALELRGLGGAARRLGLDQRSAAGRPAGARAGGRGADAGGRRRRAAAPARLSGSGGVTVYLVGAGPGDPGLLTARALELIAAADVIVYDRLIPAAALDGARADARADLRRQGGRRPVDRAGRDRAAAASSTAAPGGRSCA